jgi:hypothetical protein
MNRESSPAKQKIFASFDLRVSVMLPIEGAGLSERLAIITQRMK